MGVSTQSTWGPVLGRLLSKTKMRAFAFVLLCVAAVKAEAEAEADAYTIGQVAAGLTNGGVVTGVDYSNGVVSGLGAIGNRAYAGQVGYAGVGHLGYAGVGHLGYAGVGHLGYANQVVAAPAAYGYSGVVASPAVRGYSTLGYGCAGHYGKREAEAEADAEADAYTIGQVRAGLPLHNAYTAGHAYNAGVVSGYRSYAAPAYTGYAGVGHAGYAGHLGYAGLGYSGLGYTGAYYG